jgi:splicing factor 3A subunit 2
MSFLDAREYGSKPGSGFTFSYQENLDRRERLRQLALETIDLDKDPYFLKNHLGQYECRLCLTLHVNTGSYLAHTQGKRHQQNLARRAAKENLDKMKGPTIKPNFNHTKKIGIGRPGYRITKQYDRKSRQRSILFQIDYSSIDDHARPKQRLMSAYEQRKEPTDRKY